MTAGAAPPARPVRPRDSASLLILRHGRDGLEVLMGQRHVRAVFGDVFVFPGGKVDRGDHRVAAASEPPGEILPRLSRRPARARAFAVAAVRETMEETGLMLAVPGDVGRAAGPAWAPMRDRGLAPALGKLRYMGHAITPSTQPRRFNAHFFLTWADAVQGSLGGSGELRGLGFLPIQVALTRNIVDITQFMLEEVMRREPAGFAPEARYPFFHYHKGRRRCRYV